MEVYHRGCQGKGSGTFKRVGNEDFGLTPWISCIYQPVGGVNAQDRQADAGDAWSIGVASHAAAAYSLFAF